MSSSRSRNAEQILDTLSQYGTPLTAQEIQELIIDVPLGTVHSCLHALVGVGKVRVSNMGRKPRLYEIGAQPQVIAEDGQITDPWQAVARKWYVVFGVPVSADDARLMVEIAYREVR